MSSSEIQLPTPFRNRLSPQTQRIAEDMLVRNLADATIDAYTYHVDKFTPYSDRSAEDPGRRRFDNVSCT